MMSIRVDTPNMVILGTGLWLWPQRPHPHAACVSGTANLEGLIQTQDELRGWASVQSKINGIIWNWELCKSTLVQSNGKTTELEIHCNVLWTVQLLNVQRFLFFSDCQIFRIMIVQGHFMFEDDISIFLFFFIFYFGWSYVTICRFVYLFDCLQLTWSQDMFILFVWVILFRLFRCYVSTTLFHIFGPSNFSHRCVPCCYLFLLLLTKLKHCYTDLTANNLVLNFEHLASMIFVMQGKWVFLDT